MGLSSIASLSLGLSMSMTGTPGGAMMMRNLGVNTGPIRGAGGGGGGHGHGMHLHRPGGAAARNNCLSHSPTPRRIAGAGSASDSPNPLTASRLSINRVREGATPCGSAHGSVDQGLDVISEKTATVTAKLHGAAAAAADSVASATLEPHIIIHEPDANPTAETSPFRDITATRSPPTLPPIIRVNGTAAATVVTIQEEHQLTSEAVVHFTYHSCSCGGQYNTS